MDKFIEKAFALHQQRLNKTAALKDFAEGAIDVAKGLSLLTALGLVAGGVGTGYLANRASSPTATDLENMKRKYHNGNLDAVLTGEVAKLRREREEAKREEPAKPMRLI